MATVTKKFLVQERSHTGVFGNNWGQVYSFETNASGVFVNSSLSTAVAIADVVRFGVIPGGVTLTDALVLISDAFASSTTYKLGFQYVDGVDSTSVPQDDVYFIVAGTSSASLARTAANNTAVRPVKLPKDAYLILTVAGANHSAVGIMDVVVRGLQGGQA